MNLSKVLEKELLEGRFWSHSATLVEGCTKVSPGCLNCWSEAMAVRFGGKPFDGTIIEHPERLADILPKSARRKPRVWTYWNDLFHPGVSDNFRDEFFGMITFGRGEDYHIICTKRPEEAVKYWQTPETPMNHHLKDIKSILYLVSMENQDWLHARHAGALQLSRLGGNVGILVEPMLGPIDISYLAFKPHWAVCGPENGKKKRRFDVAWAISLQKQAQTAGVPFFYKADGGLLNGKRYLETP